MKIRIDYYPKIDSTGHDKVDDVFRGEHPDTRTDKEFLQAIKKKEGLWYPRGRGNPHQPRKIFCISNGKTYNSIKEIAADLNLNLVSSYSNMCKHLRRHPQYSNINGYEFLEVK